ncbi:hypothetical protein DH2020_040962 [Rehmannia glutinosa]|uniref:Uncharacterized protein n=1 Tax=Rehmannia glutinosa TaxID=99300 RepID=A0ABR0URI8_REHGL
MNAFLFLLMAGLNESPIGGNLVPPGTLVKLTQKGLMYTEMEANLSDAKNDDEDFTFLKPMDLITKDVDELRKIVKDKKNNQKVAGGMDVDRENGADKARKDLEKQDMEIERKYRVKKGTRRLRKTA